MEKPVFFFFLRARGQSCGGKKKGPQISRFLFRAPEMKKMAGFSFACISLKRNMKHSNITDKRSFCQNVRESRDIVRMVATFGHA